MNAYYEMFLRNWQIKIGKLAWIKKVSCDAGSHFDVNFSQKPVKPVSLFYVLFVILFLALRLYAFYFSRNFTSFLTRQLLKSASHANKWHRSQFLFQYITERKIFPRGKNLPTRFIILSSTDKYISIVFAHLRRSPNTKTTQHNDRQWKRVLGCQLSFLWLQYTLLLNLFSCQFLRYEKSEMMRTLNETAGKMSSWNYSREKINELPKVSVTRRK